MDLSRAELKTAEEALQAQHTQVLKGDSYTVRLGVLRSSASLLVASTVALLIPCLFAPPVSLRVGLSSGSVADLLCCRPFRIPCVDRPSASSRHLKHAKAIADG